MTTTVFRLDPDRPLVWRSPTELQFGVDEPVLRLGGVTAVDERMLVALRTGVSAEGLRVVAHRGGASASSVERFLRDVDPALESERNANLSTQPLAGSSIAVPGVHPVAEHLRRQLRELGAGQSEDAPGLAVLVSAWAVWPRDAAGWLRRDIPHLPVVFSDREVRIGPLVEPGRTSCVHCAERTLIDADAAWPAMAGQLMGRPAPTESTVVVASALPWVLRACVGWFSGREPAATESPADRASQLDPASQLDRASQLDPSSQLDPPPRLDRAYQLELRGRALCIDAESGWVRFSARPPHPECACRALPGTGRPPEPATGSPPPGPRRETAAAAPA